MSTDTFDPEILQDFLTESGELLEELEGDLVELEHRGDDLDLLNQVFRALHTIKGSASFLALTNLVEIAHASESALNAARNSTIVVDQALMDCLLRAIDVLKKQFEELSGGSTDLCKADAELVDALTRYGNGEQDGATAASAGGDTASDDAGTESADETAGDEAEKPGAAFRRKLDLGPGKEDLLEHFVEDLETQFEEIETLINDIGQQSERDAAVARMDEIGGDLRKTVDFFDHEPMLKLTEGLLKASAAAGELQAEAFDQTLARMHAVIALVAEQTAGLRDGDIIDRPSGELLERLSALTEGTEPEEGWSVAAGADALETLRADGADLEAWPGVEPESGPEKSPEGADSDDADTDPGVPAPADAAPADAAPADAAPADATPTDAAPADAAPANAAPASNTPAPAAPAGQQQQAPKKSSAPSRPSASRSDASKR